MNNLLHWNTQLRMILNKFNNLLNIPSDLISIYTRFHLNYWLKKRILINWRHWSLKKSSKNSLVQNTIHSHSQKLKSTVQSVWVYKLKDVSKIFTSKSRTLLMRLKKPESSLLQRFSSDSSDTLCLISEISLSVFKITETQNMSHFSICTLITTAPSQSRDMSTMST